jgi:hypothetical protein
MVPDHAIFVIDLQDVNKKLILFLKFFRLLLFEGTGTFTSIFKNKKDRKKSQNSHKKWEPSFFLLFLLDDRRIRIRTSD